MEKKTKKRVFITLGIVLAVLFVAAGAVVLKADMMAKKMVTERLNQLAAEKQLPLSWSDIDIHLLHGSVQVEDLALDLKVPQADGKDTAFVHVRVPKIYAGHIHWITLAKHRVLHIDRIRIKRPEVSLRSPKEALETLPLQEDTAMTIPLQAVRIDRIQLINGAAEMTNCSDKLHVALDSLNITLRDVAYLFADSTLTLNDSIYHLEVHNLLYCSEDGLFSATVEDVLTADAGGICINGIQGGNTDKKTEHAHRMGNVASTWVEFTMQDILTSPISLVRTAQKQELTLDSIRIRGSRVNMHRDNHYPSAETYPLPQESLAEAEIPLLINRMHIVLDRFNFSMTDNGKDIGSLNFNHNDICISNITNTPDAVMKSNVSNRLPDGGTVKIGMDMRVNPACSFTYRQEIHNTRGATLASYTAPLMGATLGGNIHSIKMECKGNKHTMDGTFCMIYDSLTMHIEDNTPFEQLAKVTGLVNVFMPAVLLKQNPRYPGKEPETYEVHGERDPWQPFPMYLFIPFNEGIYKSILPPSIAASMSENKPKNKK